MTDKKKILYIDMDGVIVDIGKIIELTRNDPNIDFTQYEGNIESIPDIFTEAPPIDGAIKSIRQLHESGKYDMYIATTVPWKQRTVYTHKRHWIDHYFLDGIFHKRIIFTHRKDLLIGDYLIDDRIKNGAGGFTGELLKFGTNPDTGEQNEYPTWNSILNKLL